MRLHVMGAPGSGKTTFSQAMAERYGVKNVWDLDFVVYDRETGGQQPADEVLKSVSEILHTESWITEGAYREGEWLESILRAADAIVWLDVPWRICAIRMLKRHLILSVAHSNSHPGIPALCKFLAYTRRAHPRITKETDELLSLHSAKAIRCSSKRDLILATVRLDELAGEVR